MGWCQKRIIDRSLSKCYHCSMKIRAVWNVRSVENFAVKISIRIILSQKGAVEKMNLETGIVRSVNLFFRVIRTTRLIKLTKRQVYTGRFQNLELKTGKYTFVGIIMGLPRFRLGYERVDNNWHCTADGNFQALQMVGKACCKLRKMT